MENNLKRLAIGTAQFGMSYGIANKNGQVKFNEAEKILNLAIKKGISTIDTAKVYGDSEKELGKLNISQFDVITKLPEIPKRLENVEKWLNHNFEDSLSNLEVEKIDGLLFHNTNDLLSSNGQEIYEKLLKFKESERIKKIGISIYSPEILEHITSKYDFDIVQAPFNIIDQRLLKSGWLKKLKDSGTEVHIRSIFLQGLLLMSLKDVPDKFNNWNHLFHSWSSWLKNNNISALETCLSFSMSFPEIDKVIIGVDSFKQFLMIIDSLKNYTQTDFPLFECDDDNLLNPSNWKDL